MIENMIREARSRRASDIHISEGQAVYLRIDGRLEKSDWEISDEMAKKLILSLMTENQKEVLDAGEDIDFAFETPDGNRQRVNVFRQQGRLAAAIRLLNAKVPTLEQLHLPKVLRTLAEEPRGLILVTGPTGSGKSTTLAAMVDYINHTRADHILTIEDPIEYVYQQDKAVIHQREVGKDVGSFAGALRSALREDPDVILVGEMRDYETISAAVTAAETGHLVLSTLHTTGAAETVNRIIDVCPSEAQNQIRAQLSGVLKGVVTQCLVPLMDGGRIAATEILTGTDAVLSQIREGKTHQLGTLMQSGAANGMHSLDSDLSRLVMQGLIEKKTALKYAQDKREFEQYMI